MGLRGDVPETDEEEEEMRPEKYLIKNGIEPWLAKLIMKKMKEPQKRMKIPFDFRGMDSIFRPIAGQDKSDIFTDREVM
jgi:hypothetical protein